MDEPTKTTEPVEPITAPTELDSLKEVKEKLTSEEKENFFKSFLADQPYVADESLFEGQVPVKFKTLSVEENNVILTQMEYDRATGVAKNTDKYLLQVIEYRLAASLVEFNKKPFAPDITVTTVPDNEKEGSTHLLKRLELMRVWPTFKISALTDAFNRFERKVRALTEESFKENF